MLTPRVSVSSPGRRSTAPWTRARHPRVGCRPPTTTQSWACTMPKTTSLSEKQVSAWGLLVRGRGALCLHLPPPRPTWPSQEALGYLQCVLLCQGIALDGGCACSCVTQPGSDPRACAPISEARGSSVNVQTCSYFGQRLLLFWSEAALSQPSVPWGCEGTAAPRGPSSLALRATSSGQSVCSRGGWAPASGKAA